MSDRPNGQIIAKSPLYLFEIKQIKHQRFLFLVFFTKHLEK
jgi:hypothetical protein